MENFTLGSLINNIELADVCFVINYKEIKDDDNEKDKKRKNKKDMTLDDYNNIWANRAVLAMRSPVFKAMLYGPMREGKLNCEPIEIIDIPYSAFYFMIQYMYTNSLNGLKRDMCIPVIYAAKKYQLLDLLNKCNDVFLSNMTCDAVYTYINVLSKRAPWSYQSDIKNLCWDFIEIHGDDFLQSGDFMLLDKESVIYIVSSTTLSISSEMIIFEAIMKWFDHNNSKSCKRKFSGRYSRKKTKIIDLRKKLLFHIRISLLTVDDVNKVSEYGIFSKKELNNLLLHISEGEPLLSSIETTVKPRIPKVSKYKFEYESNFDENGIIYFLGTNNNKHLFLNPNKSELRICSTPTNSSNICVPILTSRKTNLKCWVGHGHPWTNIDGTWISIDFKAHRKLVVTHYTLLHTWPSGLDSIRTWVLEGCNPKDLGKDCIGTRRISKNVNINEMKEKEDDVANIYTEYRMGYSYNERNLDWVILDDRKDDDSLNSGWASYTFVINKPVYAYRMFRIRSTGPDTSSTKYLTVGGIEFYGTLYVYNDIENTWDY